MVIVVAYRRPFRSELPPFLGAKVNFSSDIIGSRFTQAICDMNCQNIDWQAFITNARNTFYACEAEP